MSRCSAQTFSVIFIGSGVSTAIPHLGHILNRNSIACTVCEDAMLLGSKNRRNNVSIALKFVGDSGNKKCVLVDVGKTMRDACMRLFPDHGIEYATGVLLSHGHADAIFGLDDVRDLQKCERVQVEHNGKLETGFRITSGRLPIYLTQETMKVVNNSFSYLTGDPDFLEEETCCVS